MGEQGADGLESYAAGSEPAAGGGGVDGIVAAGGIFGDGNLEVAFETFDGGGADAGVQVDAAEDDGIAARSAEDLVEFAAGEGIETGFVDDGFTGERTERFGSFVAGRAGNTHPAVVRTPVWQGDIFLAINGGPNVNDRKFPFAARAQEFGRARD